MKRIWGVACILLYLLGTGLLITSKFHSFWVNTIRKFTTTPQKSGQFNSNSVITYLRCLQYPANIDQQIWRPLYIENISSFMNQRA